MAVRLRKDGRWTVYYRGSDGRQVEEYFGHGPDGEAKAYQRDTELGLQKRRPRLDHSGPTFLELAKEYRDKKDFNDNSRLQLRIRLEANLIPHFGHRPAAHIRPADVDDYVKKRREAGIADSTICRELTDLKAILNWATKRDPPLIQFNPIANFTKPRLRNTVLQPPGIDDTLKIIEHAPPHLKRYIFLSWYLGLRPGAVELLRLRWDAVRWDRRRLLVISADKGGPEAREVPIHEELLPELRAWYKSDKAAGQNFIIHFNGRPIKSIRNTWWTTLERAGFRVRGPDGEIDKSLSRRIRPYDLRHSFITQALERGADLKALSEVVGSSPKTLLKFYQHVTSSMHEKTVALVAPLKLKKKDPKKPKGSYSPEGDR
jgi:integrase